MKKELHRKDANNTAPFNNSTHCIHTLIRQKGSVGESEIFEQFRNRRVAIEWLRHQTSGRYRVLEYEIVHGERMYRFSAYFLDKVREVAWNDQRSHC